jgi:hypothetical protein
MEYKSVLIIISVYHDEVSYSKVVSSDITPWDV